MGENFGSFGKSRNAFGTAHRSVERLLLCDFLEHFVVGNDGKIGKNEFCRFLGFGVFGNDDVLVVLITIG